MKHNLQKTNFKDFNWLSRVTLCCGSVTVSRNTLLKPQLHNTDL